MKTLIPVVIGYLIIMVIIGAGLFLSGCTAYGQGQVSPCYYSDKCLSDVIVRELDAQKEYHK